MDVRIIGTDPPVGPWGREDLLVGMPRGRDVEAPQPVIGGAVMEFRGEIDVRVTDDGVDARGPWVQGRRGSRFLYLTWLAKQDRELTIVRRAKLMLDALDPAELVAGARGGAVLEGRLSLTGADGGPVCAAVRPPAIRWSLARGPADETDLDDDSDPGDDGGAGDGPAVG